MGRDSYLRVVFTVRSCFRPLVIRVSVSPLTQMCPCFPVNRYIFNTALN